MTNLVLHPDVSKVDIPALPEQFQRQAVKLLVALRDDEHAVEASVPLRESRVALDLSGYRSLRFGGVAYDDAFRIVFRVVEIGIEVVAVGPRQASQVFRTAQDRIHPPAPRRHMRPDQHRRRRA